METRDWSLVIFTVLTQAAVGAFLTLQILQYLSARRGAPPGGRGPDHTRDQARETGGAREVFPAADGARSPGQQLPSPLLVVLAVLSIGLFAALFHLSTPLQAARAVVNFSSSWLSREIVFGSLFAALLSALVWHEWRAAGSSPTGAPQEGPAAGAEPAAPVRQRFAASPALATWLPRLTAAAGLAFICCQIAIYLLPAQPAWNSFATPAAFGGTALRLGILGVASGLVVQRLTMTGDALSGNEPVVSRAAATLRGLALAGIAALALEFVVVPLHLSSLSANPLPAAAASVQRLTVDYGGILLLRLGLLGAAAAALGGVVASIRRSGGPAGPAGHSPHSLAPVLTCGAFGLTVASEVCGRFLFYAMQVRVGI